MLSRELDTSWYEHYYLGIDNGNFRWFVNTSNGYSDTTLGGPAPLGQWAHLVGTYDGANVKLYVNGGLTFSTPHTGVFAPDSTGITVGASHNDASHAPIEAFNGRVDEVNLYDYALNATQVATLYHMTGATPDTLPPPRRRG